MGSRFKVLLYETMHAEGTKLLEAKCDVMYAKSFEESHLVYTAHGRPYQRGYDADEHGGARRSVRP